MTWRASHPVHTRSVPTSVILGVRDRCRVPQKRASRQKIGKRVAVCTEWKEGKSALWTEFVLEIIKLSSNECPAHFQIVARLRVSHSPVVLEGIVCIEDWDEDSISNRCVISCEHPHVGKAKAVRRDIRVPQAQF